MSKNPKVIVRRSGKYTSNANGRTGKPFPMPAEASHQPIPDTDTLANPEEAPIPQKSSPDPNSFAVAVDTPAPERPEEYVQSEPFSKETNAGIVEKPIPGFDMEGASRNQQYYIRSVVILCDCSVQRNADGIFDVLARNFWGLGILTWWLRRVGKAHLVDQVKGKDLVDAIRKVAHSLHRELSDVIGRPMARW